MKKVSFLLVVALMLSMLAIPSFAEGTTYTQSPMLDALVESGELPPVEERLPVNPLVVEPGVVTYAEYFKDYQVGKYGGTLKSVRNSATWDGWIWTIFQERPIESVSGEAKDYYGSTFESWEVSEDYTTYTFHMREGMKWSDGEDLTTEDVLWKFEKGHANPEITSTWPNWLRTGNSAAGNPCTLEVVDDYTFILTFDASYPAFIMMAAVQDVYNLVAPAHYLKDFHKDTADPDELAAKCEANGFSLDQWFSLYNLYDYTSWDVAAENQIGSPSLGAWILKSMDGSTGMFERNPYYWKVDAIGQQLPYADGITSTYCVDKEAIAVKILGGECDYTYEWIPMDEIGLFAQGAEQGNYTVYTKPILHRTGADLVINWTYENEQWRNVVREYDFRAALAYAIDYDEIVDSVYFGFAEPAEMYSIVDYDPAKAAELLDGIGMTVGADGFRTYPDGSECAIELAYSQWMTTYEPTAVLVAEYLRAVGLNIQMKFVDNDLMDTLKQANDVQMCITFSHGPVYPEYIDYAVQANACKYYDYYNMRGEAGESYEDCPVMKAWYDEYLYNATKVGTDDLAAAHEAQVKFFKDNLIYIMPVQNISQPCAVSNRIMNFPTEGGYNIDNARGGEDLWINE